VVHRAIVGFLVLAAVGWSSGGPPPAAAEAAECAEDAVGDAVEAEGAAASAADVTGVCATFDGERLTLEITTVGPAAAGASAVVGIGATRVAYSAGADGAEVRTTWTDPDGNDLEVCRQAATADGSRHVLGPLSRTCFEPPFTTGFADIDSRCLRVAEIRWSGDGGTDVAATGPGIFVGNWEYGDRDAAGRPDDVGPVEAADPHLALHGVGHDGAATTWERVDHPNPAFAAVAISRGRYPHPHEGLCDDRVPDHVVLARDDDVADALAGAALTAGGPLLLSGRDRTGAVTAAEVDRLLEPGGVVFLLGGEAALGPQVEADLRARGYEVRRLMGPTRIETALAVADAVLATGGSADTVALARARGTDGDPTAGWADAVTGGGLAAHHRHPVLLTPSETLDPGVARWLDDRGTSRTLLLGGGAALSPAVEAAVPGPERVAGPDRAATAVAVAGRYPGAAPRPVVLVNGYRPDGWAFALPAAGLGADLAAPVLLVDATTVPPATSEALSNRACPASPQVDVLVVGSADVVADAVAEELEALDPAC
jgi:putative cell wall-binding protein